MQTESTHAQRPNPPAPGLFGAPALRRRVERPPAAAPSDAPRVVSVERVRLPGSRVEGSDVEVEVRGLRLRALVRAGRVVLPSLRGEPGVAFADPRLGAQVEAAALGAAGGCGA